MTNSRTLTLDVTTYEDGQAEIDALRQLGPDVGEPEDAKSVAFVDPELERQVMEVIARYPASRIEGDKVHGLAAAAAIQVVEKWLLDASQTTTTGE